MNVTRIVAAFVASSLVAGSVMAQGAAPVAAKSDSGALLSEGTILYGGTLGWDFSDQNGSGFKSKENTLALAPEVNYFIMDNLSIGLIADITWKHVKSDEGFVANQTEFIPELVGRYYMPLCDNKIIPYVGATLGGGYSMWALRDRADGDKENGNSFMTEWGLQTGFLVPLNANVMLDTSLSYKNIQRQGGSWRGSADAEDTFLSKDENNVMLSMGFLIKL